jgi:hypothetical protein
MAENKKPLQLQPAGVRFVGSKAGEAQKAYETAESRKLKSAESRIEKSNTQPSKPGQAAQPITEEATSADQKKND